METPGKKDAKSRWIRLRHVIAATQGMRSLGFASKSRGFENLYNIKSVIDESSSNKVYKVVDQLTGITYALKEFNGISYHERINDEIEILKTFDDPNLVKCHRIFQVNGKIFLLLEPLDRAFACINVASELDLARFGHKVLLALRYLHQKRIWHGDIGLSNVFVNHLGEVKVLFPGRTLSETKSAVIVDDYARFSWDIWCVGLCVLSLSKGLNWSYNKLKFDEVFGSQSAPSSVHLGTVVPPPPSKKLLKFLLCCMKTERDVRTTRTADELVSHPFFEQISLKEKGKSHEPYLSLAPRTSASYLSLAPPTSASYLSLAPPTASYLSLAPPTSDQSVIESGYLSNYPPMPYEKDISFDGSSLCHPSAASYEDFFLTDVDLTAAVSYEDNFLGAASYVDDIFHDNLDISAAASYERQFSLEPATKEQFRLRSKKQKSLVKYEVGETDEWSKDPGLVRRVLSMKRECSLEPVTIEQVSPRKKKLKTFVKDEVGGENDEWSIDPKHHPHFQRCIEHCTLFLPDCEFEKDKLVQMWIAEDCIEVDVTKRLEDVANSFFDSLVDEEIIVPSKFDNVYRRMKFKVNGPKASTWPEKDGKYVRIGAGNSDEISDVVLHLTWQCKTIDRALSDALKNLKQLRTLVMIEDCTSLMKQLPSNIFLGLNFLRTLDLSHSYISELPGSIRYLESLRYLDMSETPIKRLPESLDRLHLIQTLKLKGCFGLSALPRGLGRLFNLRHLDLDVVSQLKFMPRGMGSLIKLQTLPAFLVGKNDGCGIGELKNLNEITGSFCVSMLENVSDAKEAKEAALGDKKHIEKLELRWCDLVNEESQDTAEILENLQPHFQLKELQLSFYRGSKLPSWISNPSFTDLSSITLYKCINCDILPSIGELPSLKILHFVDMDNVKNINRLFCRKSGTQGFNAFPKLEKLTMDNMLNLEEWTGIADGDFACLQHVSIRYCPKLHVLPSLSYLYSLRHLEICHCIQLISLPEGLLPSSLDSLIVRGCPKINERCMKDDGLDWSKIASVKNIWIDFEKISFD